MTKHKVEHYVRTYWPVVLAIVSISVAWGSMDARVLAQDNRLVKIEKEENPIKIAVIGTKIDMLLTQQGFSPEQIKRAEEKTKRDKKDEDRGDTQ